MKGGAVNVHSELEICGPTDCGRRVVRPSSICPLEWYRLGAKGIILEDSTLNYPSNPDVKAHCPAEMIAKVGLTKYGFTMQEILQRADLIGYISKAIKDKAYRRIKESMDACLKQFDF
nr:unnamed protein product [Spirometra erinaceieuropaei]